MGHGQNVGLETMPHIDVLATGGSVFHKHNYRYVSFMQYLFNCAFIHKEDCDTVDVLELQQPVHRNAECNSDLLGNSG